MNGGKTSVREEMIFAFPIARASENSRIYMSACAQSGAWPREGEMGEGVGRSRGRFFPCSCSVCWLVGLSFGPSVNKTKFLPESSPLPPLLSN